ncbi:MAG: hypothetical protein DRI79_01810 [Chloroflexi bacterium]|nr:MAG: hypothetical protein DRI79_01810 [Chloroflexota bacterium]
MSQNRWSLFIVHSLLFIILLTGSYLRFTNLNWDEGQWIHPDEGHMRMITSVIKMPDSLPLYFDTHHSPLNCRNSGYQYSYGTLPLFLTRLTGEWLDRGCGTSPDRLSAAVASLLIGSSAAECGPGTFTGSYSALVGRMFSALADLGTVLLIYLIGRRLYGEAVGLLAAGLGALTAFLIQQAHFFTVDSMACFFVTLTAYFSVRAGQSGRWTDFGLAGLATGLAAACKVDAALASLLVVLAAVWRWMQSSRCSSAPLLPCSPASLLLRLLLAGLLAFVAFRIAQPYAFEGPGFFGVRPSPEWLGRLSQIRAEQSGEADLPWGQQWTNRAPILFPWINMVVWGMGLPLGLAAWAGWAVAGLELLRGKRVHLILWVWMSLIFLYQATRWVKAMRYSLSLYPILIILAAYALVRLCRAFPRWKRRVGFGLAAIVVIGTAFWASAFISIYLRPHTRLAASRWIYAHVPEGSTVANEHFDWGLPLRVDGHDPFGGMYRGIEMQNYNEDTPGKREQLFAWLDEADYIFLASNRLYASIPRLRARYPLTTEYYRALFAGELGFELVADFTSYPALGPLQFPDQENPFPLMKAQYRYQTQPIVVHLPPAEEAFSVYDHPRVLIFRKMESYSRQRVEEVLGGIDVTRALHGLTPRQATAAPDLLEFDPQTWAEQQAGGTWSEMFHRDSLLNRHPGLAAIAWWIIVTLLGWLAFPLLLVALPRLRDRGYGLARVLGLLIVAYLTWLAASLPAPFRLPNTRGTILRMVLLLALVGGGVGWFRRRELRRFLHSHWRLLLLTEGLFALLYLAWIGVRLLQPDLWHPVVGGEKPMDFAYLNAVMKSTWFPPYNPWFSGSYINYYYFGFVIVGTLIKLMGTVPAIAYNLAVPLLYALTGVGAFSVACNLFGGHRRGCLLAGVMALIFTVVLGNLGVVRLIRAALISLGGEPFPSTIPGLPETVAMFQGLWQVIAHGAALPLRPESWYWNPTRIIPAAPGEVEPITEFPAFTFLYGDLHAHMIAFPLTLLALALAVYWARTRRPHWLSLLLGGLVLGALRPTNTWDYPTYLVLGLAALWLGNLKPQTPNPKPQISNLKSLVWRAALLIGLTVLFYLPYIRHYATGYTSFEMWRGSRTPIGIYLWIHGILLFPLLTRLLIEVRRVCRFSILHPPSSILHSPFSILHSPFPILQGMPVTRRLLWLMVGAAMALSLAVEVIVLKGDIGRMNTVFKFYLQVWMLLSITAAVSLAWVREHARRWRPEWRQLWWGGMAALILGGALFLPFGIRARAIDRMSPQTGLTLDGMAFMEHSVVYDGPEDNLREIPLSGDYAALRWMQDNIKGSPVILEGLGRREYLWGNRVSIYTGLPTVIGWRWHEVQQRAMLPSTTVDWRRDDVNECYNTTDISRAQGILSRYGVRYIYIGAYERAYYDPAGLDKFDTMAAQGLLQVVYDAQGVRIYEVVGQ